MTADKLSGATHPVVPVPQPGIISRAQAGPGVDSQRHIGCYANPYLWVRPLKLPHTPEPVPRGSFDCSVELVTDNVENTGEDVLKAGLSRGSRSS
jgi:hypothetical protein